METQRYKAKNTGHGYMPAIYEDYVNVGSIRIIHKRYTIEKLFTIFVPLNRIEAAKRVAQSHAGESGFIDDITFTIH